VLGAPLAPPEASWRRVDAEALAYGLVHPARRVLRERLHIELRAAAQQLPGSEPFVLEREDGWALDERLLAALHAGAGAAQALRLALAGTELPHGPAGQTLARERVAAAGQFLARLQRLGPPAWAPALPFACALGPFELTGAWAGLQAGGQVGWQLRPASAGARLAVWLRHLALCHAGPAGAAPRTHWMFLDREMVLGPVADAGRELAHLLELYWAGLSRPPRFMGRTALALLDETETRAQGLWHNAHRRSGEALDPWYRLAFGAPADPGPIPAELRALAAPVFGRMVAAERATPEDA